MGLYKPNGIPWEGKSAVVPMKAVEDMSKLNHNWNWIPLEDIERTCRMIKDPPGLENAQGEELYPCFLVVCSECGSRIWDVNATNYCPNCGCRVKEGA